MYKPTSKPTDSKITLLIFGAILAGFLIIAVLSIQIGFISYEARLSEKSLKNLQARLEQQVAWKEMEKERRLHSAVSRNYNTSRVNIRVPYYYNPPTRRPSTRESSNERPVFGRGDRSRDPHINGR